MSASRVVVVNGPAGVGKTTVARRLAATARNGGCIHGDDLKRFVVSRGSDGVQTGLGYVGGALLAGMYVRAGYELVVFEFVFEHPRHVEHFSAALEVDVPVELFTLWAPLDVVMQREAVRADRERLGDQVARCWETMRRHLGDLGTTVDATGSVDDVVDELRRVLGR